MTAPAVKNGAGTVVAVHLRAGDGEPVRTVLEKNVFPVRQPERNHSRPIINGDDGLDKAVGEAQAVTPGVVAYFLYLNGQENHPPESG